MAKSLHLGLEALQLTPTVDGGAEISIDLVDAVIRVNSASEAIQMELFEGERLMTAFENLCSIDAEIKKNGVTKALEALVGENFGGTVSQEAVGETLKRWWTAIVAWFKRMWENIKRFFKELFDRNAKWQRVLGEEIARVDKADIDDAKFGETEYAITAIPAIPTDATAKEFVEAKDPEPAKVKFTKASALAKAREILKSLEAARGLNQNSDSFYKKTIAFVEERARNAEKAGANAEAVEKDKQEVKVWQEKAAIMSQAVTKYSKLCNEAASQMVKILKAAPKKAEAKPAENK